MIVPVPLHHCGSIPLGPIGNLAGFILMSVITLGFAYFFIKDWLNDRGTIFDTNITLFGGIIMIGFWLLIVCACLGL